MGKGQLGLLAYIARRSAQAVPLIVVIICINFVLVHLAPGDPVAYLAGESISTPEYYAQLRAEFGLDQPLQVQLYRYVVKTLQGDLGYSYRYRQNVMTLIQARLPATLILMGSAFLFASLGGIFLGVLAARYVYSATDNVTTLLALAGYSMPIFWLGQILLIVFAIQLDLFPAQGMYSLLSPTEGLARVVDVAHHLFLPALTYSIYHLTLIFRLTRTKMQETLTMDFIITARAKGVSEENVIYRHALRNALLPIVTVMGVNLGFLFAGSVLTETVYAWPGMGRLLYEAILSRDYPVLMGIFTIMSTMVVLANLVTDVVYAVIDPRVVYR